MKSVNHAASGLVVAVGLTAVVAGCSGNTALVGRESLSSKGSQSARREIVRTVDRVDTGASEIYLRPSAGHPSMVAYSADTRVMYLGRVYPVNHLRVGDIVAMQMEKDPRGNHHTHMIRVEKSTGDWGERSNSWGTRP